MNIYTATIEHPNSETTQRRITARSAAEARTIAYDIADSLRRPYTSAYAWRI